MAWYTIHCYFEGRTSTCITSVPSKGVQERNLNHLWCNCSPNIQNSEHRQWLRCKFHSFKQCWMSCFPKSLHTWKQKYNIGKTWNAGYRVCLYPGGILYNTVNICRLKMPVTEDTTPHRLFPTCWSYTMTYLNWIFISTVVKTSKLCMFKMCRQ
jgi:hypothetical protein